MDKLRCVGNNSKGCSENSSKQHQQQQQPLWGQIREDTLLPPSRRNASSNASTPTSFDGSHSNKKRNSLSKKWSIDGLFKRVSSLLDHSASVSSVSSAESSSSTTGSSPSSSLEELPLAAVTSNFRGASEYDTGSFPRVTELDAVRATRPIVWISAPDSTNVVVDNDDATMSSAGRGHRHQQRSSAALLTEAATAAPPPHNCCCSCGSSSPNNGSSGRRCKGLTTKARVESRRSSVIADCSSSDMDESGGGGCGGGNGSWRSNNPTNKRRSRASRTERYLKRQCGAVNGLVNSNNNDSTSALECHSGSDGKPRVVASRIVANSDNLDRLRPPGVLEGTPRMLPYNRLDSATRPRSEVPEMLSKKYSSFQSEQPRHIYALPSTSTTTSSSNGQRIRSGNSNSVSPSSANGANNPLVQQTLQYFSQFNDNDAAVTARIKPVPKPRKLYPQQQKRISAPPVPPSRDSSSSRSLLINGLPINRYNDTILQQQQQSSDKENNSEYSLERHSISSPSCEVRLINEGRLLLASSSDNGYGRTIPVANVRRDPLRDTVNNSSVTSPAQLSGRGSSVTQSPSLGPPPPPLPEKPKYLQQSQSQQSQHPPQQLQRNLPLRRPRSRRDSANLESALEELETIFNSLHLDADEQLLDRAERRTLEEMHYRGLTASPVPFDAEDDPIARRKTWADSNLLQGQDEVDRAAAEHRLRDDMAFRRMQSANRQDSRPASSCAGLESISYLMTPVPFGGENSPRRWEDAGTKQQQNGSGRKKRVEPDVTLDDVVFRMRHHANNTLKIADPQPPFGIPLGPIATATESDYLHSQAPSCSPASGRSPYIPSREPDLVTDDLAYRALRKDASSACSSHHHHPSQSSPMSFCSPVPSTPSPLHFSSGRSNSSFKKRHRSLASNLYGVISSSQSPTGRGKGYVDDDDLDDLDSCRSGSQAAVVSDSESLGFVNDSSSFRDATSGHVTSEEPSCPRVRVVVVDRRQSSELDLSSRSCEVHHSEDDVRSKDRSRSREPTHDNNSSASFVTCDASVASGSAKARNTSPEETTTSAKAEPENSAYKKLCQDLENLVQLTKGIDGNVPSSTTQATITKSVASNNKPTAALRVMSASEIIDGIARDDDKDEKKEKDEDKEEKEKVVTGQSTIKREISTVLDDLKNLRETCREDIKRCRESELLQPSKPISGSALESSSFAEATTAEPTTSSSSSSREKCENRDNSSKAFMRSVREAKLAGDWKESTPRSRKDDDGPQQQLTISDDDDLHHLHRRGRHQPEQPPPLQSRKNWEGEHAPEAAAVVTCSLLGTVLSRDNQRRGVELFGQATTASARLTAKCIRHITNNSNGNSNNNSNSNNNNNNNLTAQCCCCILLVFFLVLLIAIQYVP